MSTSLQKLIFRMTQRLSKISALARSSLHQPFLNLEKIYSRFSKKIYVSMIHHWNRKEVIHKCFNVGNRYHWYFSYQYGLTYRDQNTKYFLSATHFCLLTARCLPLIPPFVPPILTLYPWQLCANRKPGTEPFSLTSSLSFLPFPSSSFNPTSAYSVYFRLFH